MTVYVDDMHRYPMGRFGRVKMSHMIADTEEELHAMAAAIGLNRRWYQGDHYDVALKNRDAAVRLGAVETSMRRLAAMSMLRGRDPNVKLCAPWDAERIMEERRAVVRAKGVTLEEGVTREELGL